MKKNLLLIGLFIFTIAIGAIIYYSSIQIDEFEKDIKSSSNHKSKNTFKPESATIPQNYYQNLDLDGIYEYNVSQFGSDSKWLNFSGDPEGNWSPNTGGQILINFTGFYDRDPDDLEGDLFPSKNMSWLDIKIYKNITKGQPFLLNYTQYNVSNSECARNLFLGFSGFQSGFLIRVDSFLSLKNLAIVASEGDNLNATLKIEESYNFIYFDFNETSGGGQKTELIYDKLSGLLVWANTSIGNYNLVVELTNYSLNFNNSYAYEVKEFGDNAAQWLNFTWDFVGLFKTNPGGNITINFTGFYERDPNDFGDVFPDDKMAWLDIEIYNNISSTANFTLYNVSNSEAASNLILGYNAFQSGFLIPVMDNVSYVKELALQEAINYIIGTVTLKETNLTLEIKFDQNTGFQKTYFLYEKRTGLLLWTKSTFGGYVLEMGLIDQSAEFSETVGQPKRTTTFSKKTKEEEEGEIIYSDYTIPFILLGASMASSLGLLIWKKDEKVLKFLFTGIFGGLCFISLFVFNSWIYTGVATTGEDEVITEGEQQEQVSDITLIVDFGDDNIKTWTGILLTGGDTTVFDALAQKCDVEYKDYENMGRFIEKIDGDKGPWLYKVNDVECKASVDNYYLNNGDVIEFYKKS